MIKKILIGIAALIVILIIVIATRPAEFRVERTPYGRDYTLQDQ